MEDYVTYDQALRLRKLGFNWECNHYYDKQEQFEQVVVSNYDNYYNCNSDDFEDACSAPTLSQAQKWLREKGIDLDITIYRVIDATKDVPTIKRYYNCEIAFGEDDEDLDEDFDTYEQALSVGINKALELLK